MKKIVLFCVLALSVMACKKPEPEEGQTSKILVYAICKMDIKNKPQSKAAMDIVGDSMAVHKLSRYMTHYTGDHVDYTPYHLNYHSDLPFTDYQPMFYLRDTVNHTFSFTNDAVVDWLERDHVNGGGKDGTEHLGYIVCSENLVFCASYDTLRKVYFDPVTATEKDWEKKILYPERLNWVFDTLGYIPNSQMRANRAHLQKLLDERKYSEIIEFFKGSYHIYTCTGEEYRELARQGLN